MERAMCGSLQGELAAVCTHVNRVLPAVQQRSRFLGPYSPTDEHPSNRKTGACWGPR